MVKFLQDGKIYDISDNVFMLVDVDDIYNDTVPYLKIDRHSKLMNHHYSREYRDNYFENGYMVSKRDVTRGFKVSPSVQRSLGDFLEEIKDNTRLGEDLKKYYDSSEKDRYYEFPVSFKEINVPALTRHRPDSHASGMYDREMNPYNMLPNIYNGSSSCKVCWGSYRYDRERYKPHDIDIQFFNMSFNGDLTSTHFNMEDSIDKLQNLVEIKGYSREDIVSIVRDLNGSTLKRREGLDIYAVALIASFLGFYLDDMYTSRT